MQQRVYKKVDKYSWQKKNDHTSVEITNERNNYSKAVKQVSTSHFDILLLNVLCKYNVKIESEDNRKFCKE